MELKPLTPAELRTRQIQREKEERELALRLPDVINVNPTMTFGELAKLLGVRLETLVIVMPSRINYEKAPVFLKDPLGRKVDHLGKVDTTFDADLGEPNV